MRSHARLFFLCGLHASLCAAESVPYLTPEEALAHFQLPAGYRLELVVSDPIIKEPVAIAFDGNGRMFVAEMRAFMQDLDGTDQRAKTGRVSLHWSSKGDGVFDRHSAFIDGLVLPRMILPLDDGLLVCETDSDDLHLFRDTDGDGVADKKGLWFAGGPRGGNLEHQPSGLVWCLDNWIYTSYNAHRLRWNGAGRAPLKEPTAPNGGQWGLSQDDYGKPWFIGGAERGLLNFQQPILYGAFNVDGQTGPDFSEVWPLVGLADVEGGAKRFRPEDKTLNHFTSPCGSDIVRGDRLPAELRGDLLMCEPVGRLVRRAKVEVRDGVTSIRNPHEKSEFIRSTDPNFRPVNVTTAPDGTLYIVDMYRGVVQEAVAIRKGTYLRGVVEQLGLEKNIDRGRIWRLVHESAKPGSPPRMLDETPEQLIAHLEHPNGWWRDTAQKLLILRNATAVVPALKLMARSNSNHLARLHALWTLEGLDALDAPLVRERLSDTHPQLRIAAIRVSETLFKKGDTSLRDDVQSMTRDPEPSVVIQAMMTAKLLAWPSASESIQRLAATHPSRGVKEIERQLLQPPSAYLTDDRFTAAEKQTMNVGEVGYNSLCFACHGMSGAGAPASDGTTLAPPLAGSKLVLGPPDQSILVLLYGLTGRTYVTQMLPMTGQNDRWISAVLSYVRNSFGNRAPFITAADVARVRAATATRTSPLTAEEISSSANEWPQWRGPNSAGVWNETGLFTTFPADGFKPRWRAPVSNGFSSPMVAGGRVFVTDAQTLKPTTRERVQCFDEVSGTLLWTHVYETQYPAWAFEEKSRWGPVATPVASDGKLYTVGWVGDVFCFDARTGKVCWQKTLAKDAADRELQHSASPWIEGNLLIVFYGAKPSATVIALNKNTGAEVWRAAEESATNSSPIVITAGGARQLIVWTQDSVSSLDPATGALHWRERFVTAAGTATPVATPVFRDGFLLVGAVMLKLDAQRPAASLLWETKARLPLSNTSTALMRDGHVFTAKTNGKFVRLDATTGEQCWETDKITDLKSGAAVHLTANGDSVLMFNERGEIIRARLTASGYEELARARLIEPTYQYVSRKIAWATPAFANGHAFARSDAEIVCVSLRSEPRATDPP